MEFREARPWDVPLAFQSFPVLLCEAVVRGVRPNLCRAQQRWMLWTSFKILVILAETSTQHRPVSAETGSQHRPVSAETGAHNNRPVSAETGAHNNTPVSAKTGAHNNRPVSAETGTRRCAYPMKVPRQQIHSG